MELQQQGEICSENLLAVMLRCATKSLSQCFQVQLLEAEIYSFRGKHQEAKEAYTASIETARSSRFVHEQGLACELAGHHCRKIGDDATARSFYNQAKQCYLDWGSQMKVDCIDRALGAVPN